MTSIEELAVLSKLDKVIRSIKTPEQESAAINFYRIVLRRVKKHADLIQSIKINANNARGKACWPRDGWDGV